MSWAWNCCGRVQGEGFVFRKGGGSYAPPPFLIFLPLSATSLHRECKTQAERGYGSEAGGLSTGIRLRASEHRFAFLEKGLDALTMIGRPPGRLLQVRLVVEHILQVGQQRVIEGTLGETEGSGGTGGHFRRQLGGRGRQIGVVDNPIDEAVAQRLFG